MGGRGYSDVGAFLHCGRPVHPIVWVGDMGGEPPTLNGFWGVPPKGVAADVEEDASTVDRGEVGVTSFGVCDEGCGARGY